MIHRLLHIILVVLLCGPLCAQSHEALDSMTRSMLNLKRVDTTYQWWPSYPKDYRPAISPVAMPIDDHIHRYFDSIARANMPVIPAPRPRVNPWKSYDWTARLLPASMHFMAGASNGLRQTLLFHYDAFERRHPGARRQWWDPEVSHENKYRRGPDGSLLEPLKERFLFSKNVFAWYTDGYHATGTAHYAFTSVGIVIDLAQRQHWLHYIFDAALYTISRNAGFHTTYTLFYR